MSNPLNTDATTLGGSSGPTGPGSPSLRGATAANHPPAHPASLGLPPPQHPIPPPIIPFGPSGPQGTPPNLHQGTPPNPHQVTPPLPNPTDTQPKEHKECQ